MTAIRNTKDANPCSKCANNYASRCALYIDEVDGTNSLTIDARRECKGKEFAPRQNIANTVEFGITRNSTTLETPMATIHRDPWDKIEKTYD